MSQQEEKTWGLLAHLIPLGVFLISSFGWVAALVIYLAYKDKSKFVAFHALQQLYFMATLWVLGIISVIAFFTIVGIPIAIILWVVIAVGSVAGPVIAGIKANNGEWWEYPIVGRMARTSVGN